MISTHSLFVLVIAALGFTTLSAQEILWEVEGTSAGLRHYPPSNVRYLNNLELVGEMSIDESCRLVVGWSDEHGHFLANATNGEMSAPLYYNEGYDGYLLDLKAWRIGESFDFLILGSFGTEDGCAGIQVFYLRDMSCLEYWSEIPLTAYEDFASEDRPAKPPEEPFLYTASVLPHIRPALPQQNLVSLSLSSGWYQIYTDSYPQWYADRLTLKVDSRGWQLLYPAR
ncbi:MAG: hypothetical protein AAFY36_16430 [Bacteroidota bacterium]